MYENSAEIYLFYNQEKNSCNFHFFKENMEGEGVMSG